MKQLVCELCRGTNFGKLDGTYICQSCGSKYSLEEARRLLVEIPPEPAKPAEPEQPRIPVDHLALARQAKIRGEDAEALRHYTIAHNADPENWEAAFFTVYYNALACKISQIEAAAGSVRTALGPVLEKLQAQLPPQQRQAAYAEISLYTNKAASFLYDAARNHFDGLESYIRSSYSQEMVSRCGAALDILYTLGDRFQGIPQLQPMMLEAWKVAIQLHEKMLPFCGNAQSNRDIIRSYVQKVGQYDPAYLEKQAQSQREARRREIIDEMGRLRSRLDAPAPKGPSKGGMTVGGLLLLILGIVFCVMGLEDDDLFIVFICGLVELFIGIIFLIAGVSAANNGGQQAYRQEKEQLQRQYDALSRELNSLR